MMTLPTRHAPVREAVASILGPVIHLGDFYGASQITKVLNTAVGDNTKAIDATTLLRARSNNAADVFVLPHPNNQSVIYVCQKKVP